MGYITTVALSGLLATAGLAAAQVEVEPGFLEDCRTYCEPDETECLDYCDEVALWGFEDVFDFTHPKCYVECPEAEDPNFVGCYQDCLRDVFGEQFGIDDDGAEELAAESQEECSATCEGEDTSFGSCMEDCAITALGLGLDENGVMVEQVDSDVDTAGNYFKKHT